jgi:hypothetical protein
VIGVLMVFTVTVSLSLCDLLSRCCLTESQGLLVVSTRRCLCFLGTCQLARDSAVFDGLCPPQHRARVRVSP